jgi:NAD+ synthase (glutamine-hydrolysing)
MLLNDYLLSYRKNKNFDSLKWIVNKCNTFNNYLKDNKLTGVVLSVSGGIDSAVTLALLINIYKLQDSNLKKICVLNQPIGSSQWSIERSKELCNSMNIDLLIIDQTEIHKSIVEIVNKQVKCTGNLYSQGQLKSYMRTPINYYVSQLLNEQGIKSIVMGTGNKDEDGYLGYYCKYGDGGVDVQLISDLHKYEVYKVGKYLNVPESILNAPPSADLWEGHEDELEMGITYDFIELYIGYYLLLSNENKDLFINSLDNDERETFYKSQTICEKIHNNNLHKFKGVVNL